jgi:Secretion system C-terminal sorting domain
LVQNRTFILAFLILTFKLGFAQNAKWFSIGTQLTYNYKEITEGKAGFIKLSSNKDTLIEGNNLSIVNSSVKQWNTNSYPSFNLLVLHDTIRNKVSLYEAGKLNTLYDFSKKQGDTLFIKAPFILSNTQDSGCYVIIDSVGGETIDGKFLKTMHYRDIEIGASRNLFDWHFSGKIIEGIGNLTSPWPRFCEQCDINYIEGLRCFQSKDLQLKLVSFDCEKLFTSVQEIKAPIAIKIYPNPTNNIIRITHTKNIDFNAIDIYNSSGRLVLNQNYYSPAIEVAELSQGVYFVKISYESAEPAMFKFIKE